MKTLSFFMILIFILAGCGKGPDRSREIVVIDAGHGGFDPGATIAGIKEKDVVMQITKKVQKELLKNGHTVYVTRNTDRFLKLHERTRIADHKNGMVFVSIHANAAPAPKYYDRMHGIETYFLQKTRDARSQHIAERENASVLIGTDSLSKDVIIDSVLNGPKIIESQKLAIDVQREMVRSVRTAKDGGVRPAPFYVLVGASRPSVLVEVGYLSNPQERKKLLNSQYQDKIAKGVASGISRYLDNRKKEIEI